MKILKNYSNKSFILDGTLHTKHYELKKEPNNNLSLVSVTDNSDILFENINPNQIKINDIVFETASDVMVAFEDLKPNFNSGEVTPQLSENELSGIQAANNISANNPVATMLDLDGFTTTPTWIDYSNLSTIAGWNSFTAKKIFYMKLENIVFYNIEIQGASGGFIKSITLPFANGNVSHNNVSVASIDNSIAQQYGSYARMDINSNTMFFTRVANGSAFSQSGTCAVRVSGFYKID